MIVAAATQQTCPIAKLKYWSRSGPSTLIARPGQTRLNIGLTPLVLGIIIRYSIRV